MPENAPSKELIFRGIGVSPGIARGKIFVFGGVHEEGGRVHVFRRVESVGWYLVVTLQARDVFR